MNKLLISLLLLSGCMSVTHAVVTKKECQPPELVLGDVLASSMVTTLGIAENEPLVVIGGSIYLVLATGNWIGQMARCHHLH